MARTAALSTAMIRSGALTPTPSRRRRWAMLRSPPTPRAGGGPDTRRIEQGGHLGDEQSRIGEQLHDVAIRARRDRRQHRVLKGGVFLIARLGTAIADWNVYVTLSAPARGGLFVEAATLQRRVIKK